MDKRLYIIERHHRRMSAILQDARPLLSSPAASVDHAGLGYLRNELVDALVSYRRFVQEDICLSPIGGGPDGRSDATELKTTCAEIESAYQRFRERWIYRQVPDNWSEYRLSAQVMMKQIKTAIDKSASLKTRWSL
ncbi:hypothetical protein [Sphingomonas sp. PAMC 26617]|uniref:hypothetical protein n=1 Tax=Sphingomonas sp. PAMC 26617 TaxID=1112216 RepID=UPI000288698F|nr:hypothetical protein [Sphingomonas sp. PAMC 26617]